MKKILILGSKSYIGESFKRYIEQYDGYYCDILDTVSDEWKNTSFEGYDSVYQVAGLAHIKETPEMREDYFRINCDLAVECAKKAKSAGIGQFIYISTVSVYGILTGVISKDTVPAPSSFYGASKLKAEGILNSMADSSFKVAIIRPPMVYGNGCKGNFPMLVNFAKKCPVFPNYKNRRSFIFVDNLSDFVKKLIDKGEGGLYFPQNAEYVCTSEMVKYIAEYSGRKIRFTGVFNKFIPHMKNSKFQKVFGNLYYDFHDDDVSTFDFKESIRLSVEGGGE